MLKSKTSIFITVGILLAIAIGLQFINNQEKVETTGIKAVPLDAAVILETNDFPALIKKVSKNNKFTEEFSSIPEWEDFFKQIEFLDTLFDRNREIKNVFSENRMLCSGHLTGKNKMQFLYVLPLSSGSDENILRDFIVRFTTDAEGNERASIIQREYENYYVYIMNYFDEKDENLSFHYTFINGLFIFSFSKILFEESVRMLNSESSLQNDPAYNRVAQIVGKNVDANLFINYKYFPSSLNNVISTSQTNFYNFLAHFASWSVLDMKLKNDAILMSGFTYSADSLNNYLNVFKGQDNVENDFLDILPENTAGFLAINLSDISSFRQKYFHFLKSNRHYQRVKIKLDVLKKTYRFNFEENLYEYIEGTVSVFYMPNKIITNKPSALGIIQINDVEQLQEQLEELSAIRIQKDTSISIQEMAPVIIDASEKITAKIFPAPKIFSLLFGKAFSDINAQYYIFLDDYLITAKSVADLRNFYKKYKTEQLIRKNKNFVEFSNSLTSESNIFLYIDFFYGKSLIKPVLSRKLGRIYSKNTDNFDKLQAAALHFGVEKDVFFTGFSLKYNQGTNEKPKNVWQIQMDAPLIIQPQLVINHYTNNREVLVQDSANNLILYGTDGNVQFKRHIPGKILGKVHQIDYYKNNKLQLLFNTREHIFLVDRKGRDVENFPIKFKSPATNGLAVFDYENKKNYRIFIALENRGVYLLDKHATKVSGWSFDKTQSRVSLPLKHFVYAGKDYIVFSDEQNVYILNRRGETRVHLQAQFEKAKNSEIYFDEVANQPVFITTGKDGIVYFIFLDGTIKKMTLGTFSPNHYFKYGKVSGDSRKYFVFADGNKISVYKSDKSLSFEKDLGFPVGNSLNLFKITKMPLIGFSIYNQNLVYLYTPQGKLVRGFPMEGAGLFNIGKLKVKSDKINLITGSTENILYNYTLK